MRSVLGQVPRTEAALVSPLVLHELSAPLRGEGKTQEELPVSAVRADDRHPTKRRHQGTLIT